MALETEDGSILRSRATAAKLPCRTTSTNICNTDISIAEFSTRIIVEWKFLQVI
jgi:hypothetical protein